MFGFGKKKDESPEDALKKADKALNKGVSGFMAKSFMGKDFMNKANEGLDAAKYWTEQGKLNQELMISGVDGKAKVLGIVDTGQLINFDPVVQLTLQVTPAFGAEYQHVLTAPVSKIAVPRVGDTVSLKIHKDDNTKMMVLGIIPG